MASGQDRLIEKRVSAWRGNAERLRAALLSGDVNQSNDGRMSTQYWVPETESSMRTGAALSAVTAAGSRDLFGLPLFSQSSPANPGQCCSAALKLMESKRKQTNTNVIGEQRCRLLVQLHTRCIPKSRLKQKGPRCEPRSAALGWCNSNPKHFGV